MGRGVGGDTAAGGGEAAGVDRARDERRNWPEQEVVQGEDLSVDPAGEGVPCGVCPSIGHRWAADVDTGLSFDGG